MKHNRIQELPIRPAESESRLSSSTQPNYFWEWFHSNHLRGTAMKLSTKGRYAVTAMMHLAIHDRHGPVTLAEISQCQGISLSYLEQLFAKLRKHGLVEGVRGPGGGYRLARTPDQVTVANIISAVDERLDATRCCGDENCQGGRRCLTHQLWTDLSRQIFTFLEGITLAQFVERPMISEINAHHRHHTRRRDRIQPIQLPAVV